MEPRAAGDKLLLVYDIVLFAFRDCPGVSTVLICF
jgi:hypothetical protein